MKECWKEKSKKRPTIERVLAHLAGAAISSASIIPFQTPLVLLTRYVNHKVRLWSWQRNGRRAPSYLIDSVKSALPQFIAPLAALTLHADQSFPLPTWEARYNLTAHPVTPVPVLSSDEDTIRVTWELAQDITRIGRAPLKEIYRTLISCFGFGHSRTPTLYPGLRDLAYLSAKAFAFIHVQQPRIPQDTEAGWFPDESHEPLGLRTSRDDPDLRSALLMVDKALGCNLEVIWDDYRSLSPAHHLWMSHLFVYYAWRNPLSNDVSAFVQHTLDLEQYPNRAVVTDCLYMISILLEIPLGDETLTRYDKRLDYLVLFYCSGTDLCQVTGWTLWPIKFFWSSQSTSPRIHPRPIQTSQNGRSVHCGS